MTITIKSHEGSHDNDVKTYRKLHSEIDGMIPIISDRDYMLFTLLNEIHKQLIGLNFSLEMLVEKK